MTTVSDNFDDNSIDLALWDVVTGGAGTVTEQNNQLELDGTALGNMGLITDITYDMSEPSEVEIYMETVDREAWLLISETSGLDERDYYRLGSVGSTYYFQKKIDNIRTTLGSGAGGGAGKIYKIEMPSAGNDVRTYVGGVEKTGEAVWSLATRDLYMVICGRQISGEDTNFDDFSLTYGSSTPTPTPLIREPGRNPSRTPRRSQAFIISQLFPLLPLAGAIRNNNLTRREFWKPWTWL